MYERKPDYEEALEAARNPETPTADLTKILRNHHGEIEIAHAVARNPNCEYRLYADFYRFIPEIAADNPALDTHRENRNWERTVNYPPRVMCSEWSTEVNRSRPQIERLLWVMKNGKSAYQRDVMATEAIP